MNTFTVGNVDITLEEPAGETANFEFKMIPGNTIAKDPQVTVATESEDCYLFVKVEKSENLDNYIDYTVNTNWTLVDESNLIYRYDGEIVKGTPISILADDQVTVKSTVDSTLMEAAKTNAPELSFTAYAIQSANMSESEALTEVLKLAGLGLGA